jgi:histidinol-phosphate/aromatic aminotransferase/cobyric acid decarboxylase-like protein
VPIAIDNPRVIVARTFSRPTAWRGCASNCAIGHKDTIKQMAEFDAGTGSSSLNVLAMRARSPRSSRIELHCCGARARYRRARLHHEMVRRSRHEAADSQANFIRVNIGRRREKRRDACRDKGVSSRDFRRSRRRCRISYGTMEEMQKP